MPSSREMLDRLRAADRSLSKERMPQDSARRVAKRISAELESQARPARMGWIPMLTFVAGAVLVLVFLRWGTDETGDVAARVAEVADTPAMQVSVSGPACRSQSDRTTRVWGACSIATEGPAMRIDTIEASHVEVDGRVVHLRSGSALFDVDPVHGEPIHVAIPQGEIVVVGTRFRVVVGEVRSEVELYEGRLEFLDPSGTRTPIVAGQLVGFGEVQSAEVEPARAAPVVQQEPSAPRPERAPASDPRRTPKRASQSRKHESTEPSPERGAGPVIEAAERLRRAGRYREAAAILRKALERRWPTRTADVLSYELGRLLQRRIGDHASACTHWRAHLERFGKTRYRGRIERSMTEIGCDGSPTKQDPDPRGK